MHTPVKNELVARIIAQQNGVNVVMSNGEEKSFSKLDAAEQYLFTEHNVSQVYSVKDEKDVLYAVKPRARKKTYTVTYEGVTYTRKSFRTYVYAVVYIGATGGSDVAFSASYQGAYKAQCKYSNWGYRVSAIFEPIVS